MGQLSGSFLDFVFAFLASLELPEAFRSGKYIWQMKHGTHGS